MITRFEINPHFIIGIGYNFTKQEVKNFGVYKTHSIYLPFVWFNLVLFKSSNFEKK